MNENLSAGIRVPGIIRNTKTVKRLTAYMKTEFSEVKHTTLNPDGPGCIRIHLIPPKETEGVFGSSVAIINGSDIVPVNFTWAVMLSELIREINVYDGKSIREEEIRSILEKTTEDVKKIFRFISRDRIRKDLSTIYETFRQIAYREPVTTEIRHLSIGEYADFMKAPHRMDVMVSAMTKNGAWHCNQKCIHCYAAGQVYAEEEELSTEEWKQILSALRKAGIPQVTFTGGEPTMREDLFELIESAKWFISRLNTNGIRLTEEYCRRLHKAELDSVQITFYSSDPEIHNRLVGAPQYENTLSGIRNALREGLSVSINTPLCTLNREYVETLRFLKELGVGYVTCSGLITTGNALGENSQSLQLSEEEIRGVLTEAVAYCHENNMEIAFTSPGWLPQEVFEELDISTPSCGACLSNMAVTPGGYVVPCQSWLSGDRLGSLLTDSWESIWNHETCEEYRNYSASMTGRCPLRRSCS